MTCGAVYSQTMSEHPTTPHDGDDTTSWLEELSDAAIPASPAAEEAVLPDPTSLPPVDRQRPERPPLVPRWVWITAIAAVVLVGFIVAGVLVSSSLSRVTVPNVTGAPLGVARTSLSRVGLKIAVTEKRFSTQPVDTVLEQTPAESSEARKGDTVNVVVSAGTEDLVMPDVIGNGVALAIGTLEGKGLVVEIEPVVSDAASDTVLASNPAPGAVVRTGDTVRLQVASSSGGGPILRPYRMENVSVVIDAAPPIGTKDVAFDVAQRLRSLLEASGATVVLLRATGETATPDPDRAVRAQQASATVAVGLYVDASGNPGRITSSLASGTTQYASASGRLAAEVASELAKVAPPASTATTSSDAVLGVVRAPWTRIRLGSAGSRQDDTSFSDPRWADTVARAIYHSLGKLYGVPQQR